MAESEYVTRSGFEKTQESTFFEIASHQVFQARHTIKKPPTVSCGGLFYCMARLEGFEPPTARFVAEYSIQLSYRRITSRACIMRKNPLQVNVIFTKYAK